MRYDPSCRRDRVGRRRRPAQRGATAGQDREPTPGVAALPGSLHIYCNPAAMPVQWRGAGSCQASEGSARRGGPAMPWRLEGTYIENCNCDVVCPCGASAFAAPADYDRCNAVLAWHIDSGHVDETDVSDRSVVLVLDAPKQMSEGNWRIGMFMDDRASEEQMEHYGREIDRLGGRRG